MEFKKDLHNILERPALHKHGYKVQVLIYLNIFVSILVLFLETEESLAIYDDIFYKINYINVFLFTIEYIARVYSCNFIPNKSRFKHMLSPFMILDLLVLLPFFLTFFNLDLGFLRILRVLRIFKLLRLAKFVEFDNILSQIFSEKKEEFIFILVAFIILLFTIAPLVYYFEHDAQPEVFKSMFDALWWAVITFTTVGYGDMYPVTVMGRILTTLLSVCGIAFYAIPGSIFTASLLEKMNHKKKMRDKDKNEN